MFSYLHRKGKICFHIFIEKESTGIRIDHATVWVGHAGDQRSILELCAWQDASTECVWGGCVCAVEPQGQLPSCGDCAAQSTWLYLDSTGSRACRPQWGKQPYSGPAPI